MTTNHSELNRLVLDIEAQEASLVRIIATARACRNLGKRRQAREAIAAGKRCRSTLTQWSNRLVYFAARPELILA